VSDREVFIELGDAHVRDPFGDTGGSPPTYPPAVYLACMLLWLDSESAF